MNSTVSPFHLEYRGHVVNYYQIFQFIPQIEFLYFEFEKHYNPGLIALPMKNTPIIPILTSILYLLFCWVGPKLMVNQAPFDLRIPLACWNLFLSLFSFLGALRVVPHLTFLMFTQGLNGIICNDARKNYGCGSAGLWVQLFILSKFPELFDTFFIVVRKKQLIFLHWYHHVSVLLFCWQSYVTESGMGIFFVAMNLSVHALMYFYYFLVAIKVKISIIPSWLVTACQISQMFVGVAICCYSYVMKTHGSCSGAKMDNLLAGAVMYGTYFALFLHFAFEKYCSTPRRSSKTVHETSPNAPNGLKVKLN